MPFIYWSLLPLNHILDSHFRDNIIVVLRLARTLSENHTAPKVMTVPQKLSGLMVEFRCLLGWNFERLVSVAPSVRL